MSPTLGLLPLSGSAALLSRALSSCGLNGLERCASDPSEHLASDMPFETRSPRPVSVSSGEECPSPPVGSFLQEVWFGFFGLSVIHPAVSGYCYRHTGPPPSCVRERGPTNDIPALTLLARGPKGHGNGPQLQLGGVGFILGRLGDPPVGPSLWIGTGPPQ